MRFSSSPFTLYLSHPRTNERANERTNERKKATLTNALAIAHTVKFRNLELAAAAMNVLPNTHWSHLKHDNNNNNRIYAQTRTHTHKLYPICFGLFVLVNFIRCDASNNTQIRTYDDDAVDASYWSREHFDTWSINIIGYLTFTLILNNFLNFID